MGILSAGHRETFEPACVCCFFFIWLSACLVVASCWLRCHDRLVLNQWYWSLHNLVSCVCSMCMRPCLCVCTCVCRGQRLLSGVFLYGSPSYFLRQPLSLNVELTDPARVAGHWIPGSSCSTLSVIGSGMSITLPGFLCGSWDYKLGYLRLHTFYPLSHLLGLFIKKDILQT